MNDFSKPREHMVESQIRTADVTELALLRAFRTTPRERFVPQAQQAVAYSDRHIELDAGRVMLRPRDLGKLIQACEIKSTDVVLDIACSRGYSTAIMAQLAETVVGLDTTEEQSERATNLLIDLDLTNAAILDGSLTAGASEHGPFVLQRGPIGRGTIFRKDGDAIGERVIFDSACPYLEGFAPKAEFVF